MEKARWGALLISVFFVVSILGTFLLYTPPQIQPSDSILPDIAPTQLSMDAENVPATVELIFPKFMLIAQTSESNITDIDGAIYALGNVRRINSRFSMGSIPELGAGMHYLADVQLDEGISIGEIAALVYLIESFETAEIFPYALISVPQDIEFTHPDLNIFREGSLIDNAAEAVVSTDTIAGDEILVNITATFVGSDVVGATAFEIENLTAVPVNGSVVLESKVASLEPSLLLDLETDYSGTAQLDAIESEIRAIANVSDFNLSAPFLEAKVSVVKDENISDQLASDLNDFLHTLTADLTFYNSGFLRAGLFFDVGTDLAPIKRSILAKLDELEIEGTALQEPIGHAFGEAVLLSSDASGTMGEISSIIDACSLEFELIQPGEVLVTDAEITNEETGLTYIVESQLVGTGFSDSPPQPDNSVNVYADYRILRGEITLIRAREIES